MFTNAFKILYQLEFLIRIKKTDYIISDADIVINRIDVYIVNAEF